jgi:hypothetical protein
MRNRSLEHGWIAGRILCALGVTVVWTGLSAAAASKRVSARETVVKSGQANYAASVRKHALIPNSGTHPKGDPARRTALPREAGPRDPFKLPPPPPPSASPAGDGVLRPSNMPPGVRGLIVGDLKLEGIVSENSGHEMIAVVTNNTNRAYFLHDYDELYNGEVTRVTPQAVYFTERLLDRHGRESVQQVVMRLNPKPGDGQ